MKMVENQFNRKTNCGPNNDTEIKNTDATELEVFHTKSSAYTQQQNGRIERQMRTVDEAAYLRSMYNM